MNAALTVEVGERRVGFGSKSYELSLTRNYVSRWGMPHAVREFIQNALDSESPFIYEFTKDGDSVALRLTSEFTTLAPQTLLLGATSKADSADSIGSFGEGYKIALLVLTRMGYDVELHNGAVLWKPRFRHNAKFGEELLVIDETPLVDRANKGLTVWVRGLSEADEEEIRGCCLRMQASIGQVHTTPTGEILLERSGQLFVGGLFICKTDLHFGYNVKPSFLKLERDRQTVDGFDLKMLVKEMWFATQRWDQIADMISREVPDLEYAEYSAPALVKDACYRHFIERNPGAIAAKSQQELRSLIDQGMTKIVVLNGAYYANVRTSDAYRARPEIQVASPRQRLEAWFEDARFHMHDKVKRSFREILDESSNWTLKP